jgi:hypothetical protein
VSGTVRLSPFELAGLPLHFEGFVALGAAKVEGAGIVAYECYTF